MSAFPKNPHGWYDDGEDYTGGGTGGGDGGDGGGTGGGTGDLWTANGVDIFNANIGNVGLGVEAPQNKLHVSGTIKSNKLITTTTDITYDHADWNFVRGLIIHNTGAYDQTGDRSGTGLYGDPLNPEDEFSHPRGGRLWHAQPLTGVNNPETAEVYNCKINGMTLRLREIVDENGFTNFWNNKNIPEICNTNKDVLEGMLVFGTVMSGLIAGGLSAAAAFKGIGGLLSEVFNLGGDGGGGGGSGGSGGSGDPDDPGYVLKVYWKNIKQKPFVANSNGLVAINGDLLVSSSKRLRSIIPGTFTTDSETGSRVVSDTEAAQVTFIDFEAQRMYGKRFVAREGDGFVSYSALGIGFGTTEANSLETPVLTGTSVRYGRWALTHNGLLHKNATGVYQKIVWWDGGGYSPKNFHFFGVSDGTPQVATDEPPPPQTARQQTTSRNNNSVIDNPEITPAPTQAASPTVAQRAAASGNKFKRYIETKSTQLKEAVQRGGEVIERKAVEAGVNGALKARKVGKFLGDSNKVGKALGKAADNAFNKSEGFFRTIGRTIKRM